MVHLTRKMHQAFDMLVYFTTRQWKFDVSNTLGLIDEMSPTDRKEFCFDMRELEWNDYLKDFYFGVRRYLLKEDDATIEYAKRRYKW